MNLKSFLLMMSFSFFAINCEKGEDSAPEAAPVAPKPGDFSASLVSVGEAHVMISWEAAEGAVSYSVMRGTTSGNYPDIVSSEATSPFVDKTVVPGVTYYYMINAVNANGVTAPVTGEIVARPSRFVSVPENFTLKAVSGDERATLSWSDSPSATTFTIKYGTSSGSYPVTVATDAKSPFLITGLENDKTYYFMVTAENSVGKTDAVFEASATPSVHLQFAFVDGDRYYGLNYDREAIAERPKLLTHNSKLYATWAEGDYSEAKIRVAEYDGATWKFVHRYEGINHTPDSAGENPFLVEVDKKLYAVWTEMVDYYSFARVKQFDGQEWLSADGGTDQGLNKDPKGDAEGITAAAFGNHLYVAWLERAASKPVQLRVKQYDGAAWKFVAGEGENGLNKDPTRDANNPSMAVYNSKLYLTWQESDGKAQQIRVAEFDGTTWKFVDGDGPTGLNKDVTKYAEYPVLASDGAKLYLAWQEKHSTSFQTQIRLREFDGQTWKFIDGDTELGLNKDPQQSASHPALHIFDGKFYVAWEEENEDATQIRLKRYRDGAWVFADGDGIDGLNRSSNDDAHKPVFATYGSSLFMSWLERGDQVRVGAAM